MRSVDSATLRKLVGAACLVLAAATIGCGGSALGPGACGAGTHLEDGKCVVDVVCGPGTSLLGGVCLAASDAAAPAADGDGSVTCGAGTELVGNTCVPIAADAGPPVTCGAGTQLMGNTCVVLTTDGGAGASCGTGTPLADAACVPDAVDASSSDCAPGTQVDADQCTSAPDGGAGQFIIRVGTTTIGADGYSAIPVVILGTDASGAPSTATVVLDTSRPGAGSLSPSTVTLTPTGTTVYFTPCSAAASMWCVGSVQITLALASAPTIVVAESQELTLVAPTGIGSDAPCLGGGDVIFYDGDPGDYIFSGTETITQGKWSATATSSNVHINVTPSDSTQGLWWDLYFDSSQLGMSLAPQVYTMAERWPFESPGHPGLDVSGDGRGCNTVTGSFQIEDLQLMNGTLMSFTATFEHHCEGGTPALRGCVHYGM
jgi:hypothetical protein